MKHVNRNGIHWRNREHAKQQQASGTGAYSKPTGPMLVRDYHWNDMEAARNDRETVAVIRGYLFRQRRILLAAAAMLMAALSLLAADPDLYVNFEGVAAGTTDSSINMGTISKTNGSAVAFSWTGSAGKVSVENGDPGSQGLLMPVRVAGTWYTNSAPTKHLLCKSDDTVSSHQKFTWTFAASRKISAGFSITISNYTGDGSFYNPMGLESGGTYTVHSLINNNPPTMQCETNSNVGAAINVFNNRAIWVTVLWDSANGKTIWDFYNQTNMVLLGRSIGGTVVNATIATLTFGITDAHSKDAGTAYRMNNLILYTNGNHFPVWPGGNLHMPTNLTPAGVTAALADASNGDTILLPATNATWTSGVTVSKDNLIIGGAINRTKGTNETVITADGGFTAFTMSGNLNTVSNLQVRGDGTTDEADGFLLTGLHNRLSHLYLRELNVAVYAQDYGLVDNCKIDDSWKVARIIFPSSYYAANYPLAWDSTNQVVFEDFSFSWTSAKNQTGSQNMISSQMAQSFTVRHGTITLDNASTDPAPLFDYHGDDQGSGIPVPGVAMQIYKVVTTLLVGDISGQKYVDVRGSRSLIYSNQFIGGSYDAGQGISYREERVGDSPNYLVNNSYVWENYDGTLGADAFPVSDDANITAGVDYFTTAPSPLVQLAYPHPMRAGAAAPIPGTIQASVGAGRARNVSVGARRP